MADLSPEAAAPDISGTMRVDSALKNEPGKNSTGNAIPFKLPKAASERSYAPLCAANFCGTIRLSIVRSPVVRYRPAVMGNEMAAIRPVTE